MACGFLAPESMVISKQGGDGMSRLVLIGGLLVFNNTIIGDIILYFVVDKLLSGPYCEHMARLARVVTAGYSHHLTQRGVRSLPIFTGDGDRRPYLDLLRNATDEDAETKLVKHIFADRPLGSASFTAKLEKKLGRRLAPGRRGWPTGKRRKHK